MKRTRVSSSCLRSVGHDGKRTLEVEFRRGGAVYQYRGASKRVATNLAKAGSVGRHFVRNVRNEYPYTKVRSGHSTKKRRRR